MIGFPNTPHKLMIFINAVINEGEVHTSLYYDNVNLKRKNYKAP